MVLFPYQTNFHLGDALSKYTEHFSTMEMTCRCGCGDNDMQPETMEKLEALRVSYGKPIRITSAKRCFMWNMKVGGKETSFHLTGMAVDILVSDDKDRYQIIKKALEVGFTGIGVNKSFIHLDNRPTAGKAFLY